MRRQALGVARVLAAPADVVAIFVVEAGSPAPLALLLRLGIIAALDVAMAMPVARGAEDRKGDEPDRNAGEDTTAVARLGLLYRDHEEARRQDGDQARSQSTLDHAQRLAPKLGKLLARMLNSLTWRRRSWRHFLQGNASWNALKTVERAGSCIFSGLRSAQST
jgi:hypothetical protein